jgi:hypothetical protein
MNQSRKFPWKRISVEAPAIVASILLAFAIDAWWEERLERQLERNDLESIHGEFKRNRDRMNEMVTGKRAQAASNAMYELIAAHLGRESRIDIPNDLVRGVRATPTFDAVTPVLDGLVSSGRLEKIRDRNVLFKIHYWQRHLQQVQESELSARKLVYEQLIPAFVKRGNMGPSFNGEEGVTTVTIDEELLGLVAHRASFTRFVLRTRNELEEATNDVVAATESALNMEANVYVDRN